MTKKLALLIVSAWILAGCGRQDGGSQTGATAPDSPAVLTVLAGSELKDIEPLLPQIAQATGVQLRLRYAGTLGAVEQLQAGDAVDTAWLASNRYAMLVPQVKARILASERTMLTPVVLGMKESKARQLGWVDNKKLTWKDIANAAKSGKFTFGMTSPASSNTGFSALLGLAAALSGKGDALDVKDIDGKRLASFFKAQRLTAGSSGWLADAYVKEPNKVDGIINYASTLMSMNRQPELKEKLVLIYPQDGIVTADYPFMLINGSKRASYNKVVAYLRDRAFQQAMASSTLRRSVNPDVVTPDQSEVLVELPFPSRLEVVDSILVSFDNEVRLPPDSTFVLDKSGSMNGARIASLKLAMTGLSGTDASISGRFARFRNRERVFLLPFDDTFGKGEAYDMGSDARANQANLVRLEDRIRGLQAGGGTAIFSASRQAYMEAADRRRNDPERFYSIVLLTDGQNTDGISAGDFEQWYANLPEDRKGIRIFPILFGDADSAELNRLAAITGGKVFDSRKSDLRSIFKEIRGYQ